MSRQPVDSCDPSPIAGFTLVELLVVVTVVAILAAISVPAFSSIYGDVCLKAVAHETQFLMREAKQRALDGHDHAVIFDVSSRTISLHGGRGADETWRTADDPVVRRLTLPKMICFGHGSCGPIPGLSSPDDGISFQGNNMVCNADLTGNAGTVYFTSPSGAAMAITVNSADFSTTIRRWNGSSWVRY